jgi:transposase
MRVHTRSRYDETFKQEALVLLERSDRTLHAVAVDLGVEPSTLRYWYKRAEMAKKGKKAGPPRKALPTRDPASETPEEKIARLERENASLRKKNAELEMDRAILKKAAAFFAKESE